MIDFDNTKTLPALTKQFKFEYPDGTDEQKRDFSNGWWSALGALQAQPDLVKK